MKRLLPSFSLLLVLGVLALGACSPSTPEPTVVENLSRAWRVTRALVNNQQDNTTNYSAFRITFQRNDQTPTNYTVVPGNAPRPNLTATNTGTWALATNNTQIQLDAGGANAITLEIVGTPTDQALTIRWRVPRTVDKTEPTLTYELAPAQ
ncbi:MAG: hypothetical protein MUC97_10000 [Bernardetiaceae bacterium]|jgi:hypothetical protein|nr:hypothetical protein [Bernardetiaceae bacterium]